MKKLILKFQIICTHAEGHSENGIFYNDVYFTGYCDTRLFKGVIREDGVDHQQYKEGQKPKLHAIYTFDGIDKDGKPAVLHVDNSMENEKWHPVIKTDNENLSWLNTTSLSAELVFKKCGPYIRIYADSSSIPGDR